MKNKKVIKKVFLLSDKKMNKIKPDMPLSKLGWDSLTIINLMTYFSDKHNISLKPNYFQELSTISDLDKFIGSKLKNKK